MLKFSSNLTAYIKLMRLDKPIGIYLLLWPSLTSLFIAGAGAPAVKNILIFVLGVIVTRSAGCVINDYADLKFDKHVERTRDRPITSGKISKKNALILFVILLLIALVLVMQTNKLTVLLSIPAAILMSVYPLVKRFSNMPQFVLGLAFSMAVPMAFAAETNNLVPELAYLVMATIFWAVVYDTIYAMVDIKDDLKIGVKSTAILFGSKARAWIGLFQALMFVCLALLGVSFGLSMAYYLGLAVAIILATYHQTLIRSNDRSLLFKAFLHNHWLGFAIFSGTFLSFYIRY